LYRNPTVLGRITHLNNQRKNQQAFRLRKNDYNNQESKAIYGRRNHSDPSSKISPSSQNAKSPKTKGSKINPNYSSDDMMMALALGGRMEFMEADHGLPSLPTI
jgi:hypothetical protein